MEPLFINQYIRDEAVTKEYHLAYYFRPLFLCVYVFVGFSFIVNLVSVFMGYPLYAYLLFLSVIIALYLFLCRRRISIAIQRDREQFGTPPSVVFEVTESGVRVGINGSFSQEVPFGEFRKAKETKHLILLTSKARLLYIFHKEGFSKGTLPEFNRFLGEKGIEVR